LPTFYTAAVKRSPGRKALNVDFRHPLRNDSRNRPGKKTHRALGTEDPEEAQALVDRLNQLLRNESLWSPSSKLEAIKLYGEKVAEIFYGEIEPQAANFDKNEFVQLPSEQEMYSKVLLIGVPGAGKSTLMRQLLGTHPKRDRFPATSINRTTTYATEIVLRPGPFEAVVTFISEYETRFEIEDAIAAAITAAIEGLREDVATVFLEKSDMRFRLKYILGDLDVGDQADPYAEEDLSDEADDADQSSSVESEEIQRSLNFYVDSIIKIASQAKSSIELVNGKLESMSTAQRFIALDEIEESATSSDEFLELVSMLVTELRLKFDAVSLGQFKKTTTGWPIAWYLSSDDRGVFLKELKLFSDNNYRAWGRLLSPLVSSMRVAGPFKPMWSATIPRLVLTDTEGLGHKADTAADVPEKILPLLDYANIILLVESAKSGMTNIAAGKALEAIVNTGHTRKLGAVFTGMDVVKGDNLKGKAKIDHVFSGLRNVVENHLAKNISVDAARALLDQLRSHTFYLGDLDQYDAKKALPELNKLLGFLTASQSEEDIVVFPVYRDDKLGFAIQEAAKEFRELWQGYLGFAPGVRAKHYNSIKAMSRRYAEGFDDGYELRPHSNLLAALRNSISRYLEVPETWSGNPTPEQKRATIDLLKTKVARELPSVTRKRIRDFPRPQWQEAYALRGTGTTKSRATRIETIFGRSVPVPMAVFKDREPWEFLDEVKDVVNEAIDEVKEEVRQTKQRRLER
jgi:energy-coupling factor transporter ATP-binding protein EcfA2